MRFTLSAFIHEREYKEASSFKEYGYAKHAHFQDKQNQFGMSSRY